MARLTPGVDRWRPRTADVLERALDGDEVAATDRRVVDLLPTAAALQALPEQPGPDPRFVAALAERLAAEAEALAAAGTAPGRRTASRPPARGARPVVLVVGRSVPRQAAGLIASLLVVAAVVGLGSQRSLPGQALYPVKQVLDAVQVQLAGSGLDRGTVQLAQAAEHVGEVGSLVADGARPAAADVDLALGLAVDRTRDGRASLEAVPGVDRGRALAVQGRFLDEVGPQLLALRGSVPAGSLGSLTALRTLVGGLAVQVREELVACGGCAPPLRFAAADATTSPPPGSATTGAGAPTGSSGTTTAAGTSAAPGVGGTTAPRSTATRTPSSPSGVGGTSGGAVPGPGVGVGSSGASVGGGAVTATLPGVTATVGVPTVTVGGGGVGVTGTSPPAVTLPPVTLPPVTGAAPSTTVGVGGGPVVSSTCVLGLCPR